MVKQAVLFCNTKWFALNFKFEICDRLLLEYNELIVVYLRDGPPYSVLKQKQLENKGCKFLKFNEFIFYRLKNTFRKKIQTILITFTLD